MPSIDLLRGIRVVSIAQNVPGPLAVARLAANGASATKIEPLAGDPFTPLSPAWYEEMHRGVNVERLDLKSAEGRARLLVLLRDAHLFITSHRPSALARLRIDPASLHAELPALSIIRVVGSVSNPEEAGHDLTYQAHAGLARETMPLTLAADVMASERVYATALELLRQPSGLVKDVGLVDSLEPLRAPLRHGLTAPTGVLGGAAPRYRIYATRDGHVALAALEPHFERRFYELLNLPVNADPSAQMQQRSTAEWESWARENDVPLARIART
ncbi:MAG TPA: CoA transferase [Gemmatimonadaceae bacterium]|jgi:crotonobetainyl-CoA:carnitine CoA-transferase CaiB-like acyl-CoA transferase